MEQDFHVGMGAEAVAALEIAPQSGGVVDLTVADQAQRAGLVRERLAAVLQIDDLETPTAESDRPTREDTALVGTAVTKRPWLSSAARGSVSSVENQPKIPHMCGH
jgi:hypothetical protein